jgi:Do/DeqQ family serine protease
MTLRADPRDHKQFQRQSLALEIDSCQKCARKLGFLVGMTIRTSLLAAAAALAVVAPAAGQSVERRVPPDAASMKQSFAPIVRRTAPATVNIVSRRTVRQRTDPFWEIFGAGVPRERIEQSLGSGAIVRADGIVVTNHHVVEGMQEISVVLNDRRQFPAKVLLDDARSDLAVLKIDVGSERLPTINIDDREGVEVGDLVLAIGNPFGVGQTVTNGIVSALARTDVGITDYSFFIQTDAAINPGNSGGPLVDMDGDLIGLNTAIFSRSGSSSGVGFAIPAKMVRQVVDSAMGGARSVQRPWLGARLQAVDVETARSLGMAAPRGVVVTQIYPGSLAADAGLRDGDVILAVDGQAVNDESAVTYRVGTHRLNDTVQLQIRRGGAERSVSARAEPPPSIPTDQRVITGRNPLAGATIANLSPAEADAHGLDPFMSGVFIAGLAPDSIAAGVAQLRPGDMILAINGQEVRTTREVQAAVASDAARAWRVRVQRGGQVAELRLNI